MNTPLHIVVSDNTKSLEFLIDVLGEKVLEIRNKNGDTVLHCAAQYNQCAVKLLITKFPRIVKSLLQEQDMFGRTVLELLNSANDQVVHKLIEDLLNSSIHGAESGIAIPGLPDVLSYYYQKQVSFLLKLRLEDAKPGALKLVDVLEDNYTLRDGNEDYISAKLSSFILASAKETILMPLNIGGSHLVGIAARKHGDKVALHYMDSERNPLPESLFAKISATLKSSSYSTKQVIVEVEKQNYSNCGPEVIENLTAFVSCKVRTSQEKAIPKHSTLFEEYLLKDSSKRESTSDSSPNDSRAHESTGDSSTNDSSAHASIIKSMPVLSESATTLGNMLFYKISRVSDMKKSIELNIANTNLLVDAKTQAQLIYYYNTGELLPSARTMLERNSAAIQEHYKFSISNETFEVSMPNTLLADGKLEAQVLHYLRTGELFDRARSALESGAVRVISRSSTVSEEEVEKTVQLQSLMRTPNRESHNDSGETMDFSEDFSTNENTGGLFKSFLDSLPSFS